MCNVYQQYGRTPLLTAVNNNRISIVRYLVNECKADITRLDEVRLSSYYVSVCNNIIIVIIEHDYVYYDLFTLSVME